MTHRPFGRRFGAVAAGFLVAAVVGAGPLTPARAAGMGGYRVTSVAMVATFTPMLPGVTVVKAPAEGTIGLAHTTLATGPASFARSSYLWPGDLVAGLGALLAVAAGIPGIPPYPLVVEAVSPDGDATTEPVPGSAMRAKAEPEASSAGASVAAIDAPGVLRVGGARASTTTALLAESAEGTASAELSDVDLLDGTIKAAAIKTTVQASTAATTAASSSKTTVTGLEVMGTPVVLDDTGLHVSEPVTGREDQQLTEALAASGVKIEIAQPTEVLVGASVMRVAPGVRVIVPVPEAGPIPAPGELVLTLGGAMVEANSTPSGAEFDFGGSDVDLGSDLPDATAQLDPYTPTVLSSPPAVPRSSGSPMVTGKSTAPAPSAGSDAIATGIPASSSYVFEGVQPGMVLGLLVAGGAMAAFARKRLLRFVRSLGSIGVEDG